MDKIEQFSLAYFMDILQFKILITCHPSIQTQQHTDENIIHCPIITHVSTHEFIQQSYLYIYSTW